MIKNSLVIMSTLFLPCIIVAQVKKKDMVLDSGFLSKAERMEVKMGMQVSGKLWNYKFGDYHLTENKLTAKPTKESSNFLGTKSEFSSRAKFRFELSDKQEHSAKVEGSIQNEINSQHAMLIGQNFYIGDDKLTGIRRNFLATLNTNDDTTTWKIIAIEKSDSTWIGLLTNGARKVDILRIYKFEDGKSPAMGISAGCELRENGVTIGAVQYFGNRYNNNVIWLLSSIDPKEKCLLAAALTALMASAHNGQESLEFALDK